MGEAAIFFQKLIEILQGLKDGSQPKTKLTKTYTSIRTLKPFVTEEEKQMKVFDSVASAVEALRAEIMKGNWKEASSSLVYVLNHGRHIEHFVWRLGLHIIWNHREAVADHLKEFLKVARSTSLYHHEIRLIGFVLEISAGMYNDAKDLALKMQRPSRTRKQFPTPYMQRVAKLMEGYKGVVEYARWLESSQTKRPDGTKRRKVSESVRIALAEKAFNTLSPLFDNVSEAPHLFLAVYLKLLSAKEGEAVAKTYALNVSKAREEDLAIQATINSFFGQNREVLERMVKSCPGDTCAFDLARILLQGGCSEDSGNEDDCSTPSDFDGKDASRALNVVANALDFPENYTSITGWSLFWQAIKKVCTIGTPNCAKEVGSVYEDRKSWWSTVLFADGMNEAPNLRLLKASCCYVLETEDHPYVQTALQNDAQQILQKHIKQIKPRKKELDAKRAAFSESAPVAETPTLFYPDSESDTGTIVYETECEALSESEMTVPKSAIGYPKSMPPSYDRRFRPRLKDLDVFTRLRKRLQLKKERRLARDTGKTDVVSTVVFEDDVTLFESDAQSPCTTDGEYLRIPEPRVKTCTIRRRTQLTKRVVSKPATGIDGQTTDSDSEPEDRSSLKKKSDIAASALARSRVKSPSPRLLALSPEPSLNGRMPESDSSSSSKSDSDEDKMSLSILSDRSSYHTLPRTPAQKRPRLNLPELFPSDTVSRQGPESENVSEVSYIDRTVQGQISNTSSRASLHDDATRTETSGKNSDVYAFNSDDEKPTMPISARRKYGKPRDAELDQSFQSTQDLFATQVSVEQEPTQFQYIVPETEDIGIEETGELGINIPNVRSGLTQEEERRVNEVVQNILQSRAKDSASMLECQVLDEDGQDKNAVKDWVSNLDILSFVEEEPENSQRTMGEEPYDETSLNLGIQELDSNPSKAHELSGGEASLISTATPKKTQHIQGNATEAAPENAKQQLFSKPKRTGTLSKKSRKLKNIPEDDGEYSRSESNIGRLHMSEDDEPANSSASQTTSVAGADKTKSKKRKENTHSEQTTDELLYNEEGSGDPSSPKESPQPVKKKKRLLATKYHSVSDSILEEVSESNIVQSKNAPEQPPVEIERPEEPESGVFVRPDSRQIVKPKTKKEAMERLYSETSSVTSVEESSDTSKQDRLNDSIESSASSMRKKKKKKKKKQSTLVGPVNSQVSSTESVSTVDIMKENMPALSNSDQDSSQILAKKKKKKKSKNKNKESVGQESTQGEKTVSVVSEESCMSLIRSETQQAGLPKLKKKKKKKKKSNNQIATEVQVGVQKDINELKRTESPSGSNFKPRRTSSPSLVMEVGPPGLEESALKLRRNETAEGKKANKKKSSPIAKMKTPEASEKPFGSENLKSTSTSTRAGLLGVEKDERNLTSGSVEAKKEVDRKRGAVEASIDSVDVSEEDDDYDAYVTNFIKEFVANPTAPKRSKTSRGRTSFVSSGTPTGEESSESVSTTKKARQRTASIKVDKATKSQSSRSIQLDGSLGSAPVNVNEKLPQPTHLDAGVVALAKRKKKLHETESRDGRAEQIVEKVAEKNVGADEDYSHGKTRKVQLDDNHYAERETHTNGVTSADSDDEDSAFISMYVKNFLTNSGTPKQAKEAKVKTSARRTPKTTASKRGNSSFVSTGDSGVHNNEVTSQNGEVAPTASTSSTSTMNSMAGNSEQLASGAIPPVKSTIRSDAKKKFQPKETSSSVLESSVGPPSVEGKNDSHVERSQASQELEGNGHPGLAIKDKSGTTLDDDDDDNIGDDFLSKYLKDYLTGVKQPNESKKDAKKQKKVSDKEHSEVKQPRSKGTKGAASLTSLIPAVTESVIVKGHDRENKTVNETHVLGNTDQPKDIVAISPLQEKSDGKTGKKPSRHKDTTDVFQIKAKKPTSPADALSKHATRVRKANVKGDEESHYSESSPTLETRKNSVEGSGNSSPPELEDSSSSIGSAKTLKKKGKRDKADSVFDDGRKNTDVLQTDDSDGFDIKKATDLILQKCLERLKKN